MAVWLDEIDLSEVWKDFRNLDLTRSDIFTAYRDRVVKVLRTSEWARELGFPEKFRKTTCIEEFNEVMNSLYDEADDSRVWINTF